MVSGELSIVLFIVCLAISITLIFKGINIALAIFLAFIVYSIPALNHKFLEAIVLTINMNTLNTLASLLLAMMMAELYRGLKVSEEVVKALEKISSRIASIAIPMLIGLIPMPGGAYISATMVNSIYDSIGLKPEEKTFINFWFRHIWVTIWPLYQAIILSSVILNLSIAEIIKRTWVIALSTTLAGISVTYVILNNQNNRDRKRGLGEPKKLVHIWPFAILAFLSLVAPIPLPLSITITITLILIIYKPSRTAIYRALRYALNPTFIVLVFVSLMFSNSIKLSGLAEELAKHLYNFSAVAALLIPFTVVMATGLEFTFVALTFPALKPLLFQGSNIVLAFLGGVIGSLLSPTHACLVLSAQYFRSPLQKVYKYTIPASIIALVISLTIVNIWSS
ncbi:MAG: DUF401 family protein [Ignisphaera sp.]